MSSGLYGLIFAIWGPGTTIFINLHKANFTVHVVYSRRSLTRCLVLCRGLCRCLSLSLHSVVSTAVSSPSQGRYIPKANVNAKANAITLFSKVTVPVDALN